MGVKGEKKVQPGSSISLPEIKILIIEDDPDHLTDMKEIVNRIEGKNREFSLDIDEAKSKEEAEKLLFLDENRYHILIVDIMLLNQKDGGMKIIERLDETNRRLGKKENEEESILVITQAPVIVSHLFDEEMRKRAHEAGVKAYFVKPIPILEFRKVLNNIIKEVIKKDGGEK